MGIRHNLAVAASLASSMSRNWYGTVGREPAQRPAQPLKLYEFEACPYCRKVREALTELDLDALILPCPQGGSRYRPEVEQLGGKAQFPYLVDENTGTALYESDAIIAYLYETYGGRPPRGRMPAPLNIASSTAASAIRGLRGLRARPNRAPAQPLELFSFETSPFSRLVRERLCELEIPYLLRNTGKIMKADMGPSWVRTRFYADAPVRGPKRIELLERGGKLQVPYLVDPNTGTAMYESADILRYLDATYGA